MADLLIVGAGISGLALANFLLEAGEQAPRVRVLEASSRPGGKLWSETEGGRVLDHGPNGWLDDEPALSRLVALAGLRPVLASGALSTRWIYADGRMQRVPMRPPELLKSPLLPLLGRLRLLLEPLIRRGDPDLDESVASFIQRRLGRAALDRLAVPMVAGVWAAEPEQLSVRAAFPRLFALEEQHRSLLLGLKAAGRAATPPRLNSLPGGAGALSAALASRLGDRLVLDAPVTALERRRQRWLAHSSQGQFEADALVLALPAAAAAATLRGLDPEAASLLDGVQSTPVAVATAVFPSEAWPRPPEGFGVLVARGEDVGALGTLFASSVFPDQVPEGEVLLRTFLGGGRDPGALDLDDQALGGRALAALERFLGPPRQAPLALRIFRHPRGIPCYAPGHLARVRGLRAAQTRHPGLFFSGNSLDGVAVKDCARAAERLAEQIGAWLGGSA